MSQPIWKFVANLGDASPLDHGGLFLYVDETGVYPPELEKLERLSDADDSKFEIHRVCLDRCKEVRDEEGERAYLVSYDYTATWPHPLPRYDEWFAKDLKSVAACMGGTVEELRALFCSEDPNARAEAYRAIYDYHGWENGDGYPLTLDLEAVKARYTCDEI